MTRVRMLGLDGMSVEWFERLADSGLLPSARTLLDSAPASPLLSTIPSYTIPGWTSTFTGVRPGRHGLLWWRKDDPKLPWRTEGPPGVSRLDDAQVPTLWRLISASQARVTVLDVPATFPAPEVNGTFVSGWLAPWPHARAVWPPEFSSSVRSWRSIGLRLGESPNSADDSDIAGCIRRLTEATLDRLETFRSACRSSDDFVSMVLVGPDRLGHWCWDHAVPSIAQRETALGAAVAAHWSAVESFLHELVEAAARGDSVLVSSDHGSAEPPSRRFHTRTWLMTEGFLHRSKGAIAFTPRVRSMLRPVRNLTRPRVRRFRPSREGRSVGIQQGDVVDLAIGDREAAFFVNPDAIIKDALIAGMASSLGEAVDRDGRRVFESVLTAREALGDVAEGVVAPDLIAITVPGIGVTPGSIFDETITPEARPRRGIHQREGVLLMAGGSVPGAPAPDRTPAVEDVSPTILSMLGYRPPPWMSGRNLAENEGRRDVSVPPATTGQSDSPSISEAEQREIEVNLRSLGYLD